MAQAPLAILGGTFNPPHVGHLHMAEAALGWGAIEQVIWVPNDVPPHRRGEVVLPFHHRYAMVERAIAPYPQFTVSRVDGDRAGPSYASDTLAALQQQYPQRQWAWIIGLDAFQSLVRWHDRQWLIPQCIWLVVPRRQRQTAAAGVAAIACTVAQQLQQEGIALRWQRLEMPQVEVSSSQIRQLCRDRQSIRGLVPDAVVQYIADHALYAAAQPQC
ncbi:nicotinate (nicotinamide) nucleotide adenylyltransferase [Leptolyngbya sp. AN02str]|uniref:nicotinate (nicotinamide) nucleotide adenylyltransferase n=1 Tax=Leptolyngbya sp. AN02str TaxID=3423363 RepID=UPI003D321605